MPNPYKIISLGLIAAFSLGAVTLMPPRVEEPDAARAPTLGVLYAAPVERAETHVLRPGQTLSTVLSQARITGQEMSDLLLGLRQHMDPRRLPAGSEVTVRRWSRDDQPRAVDVRLDADRTVRLMKADMGWDGRIVITPIRIDTVYGGGTIEAGRSTLYETVVFDPESKVRPSDRPQLVVELAGIYEYKLDFTREIQVGDSYRVAYERESRPDGSARSIRILAAEIVTRGQAHPAIWFDENAESEGYYDNEARPLRNGFSKYPVDFARVTSAYNPRRYHPVLGVYRAHQGTDFGGGTGTPVKVTANGTVTFAGTNGGYGRMIEVRHINGYTTRYAHLSRFASGIRVGARVTQKDVIGYIGATGLATAPHLHYELRKNGRAVNAMKEKLPEAPRLPGAVREQFMALAPQRSSLLERVSAPAGKLADTNTAGPGTVRAVDET
ncbi:MAG TPA: M23 family metallopeptidase [Longimicrobiales bacterium]|nr:M23 family metallopeptidase [Longimicrobiales bacterium]